jgi:hypothetical protein
MFVLRRYSAVQIELFGHQGTWPNLCELAGFRRWPKAILSASSLIAA